MVFVADPILADGGSEITASNIDALLQSVGLIGKKVYPLHK